MVISKATKAILDWAECPVALTFPYAAALTAVRAGGKHFIETEVLHALAHARQRLPPSADETTAFTRKFLDVVLDKYDNKYDYPRNRTCPSRPSRFTRRCDFPM
ncbi:hypothetical protein FKK32_29910 [Klebsiella pneumoniae]|nr:hypothetical protein [Klebsiella pneumoniae]